ncbi:hypothetical protein DYQ86_19435 [Acidobacteria bacterium AB60]|nr:hypothetical protein DYQ86_19435 [Acidobacteria bacterium AB60]
MTLQLRPANLGEILDRTAALYRARFLVFVGIAAIPSGSVLFFAAVGFLLSAWIGSADPGAAFMLGLAILGVVVLAVPVCLGLTALGSGAISHAANLAFLGERTSIRGAYAAAWNKGWRYVGLLSLEVLFLAIVPFTAWVLIVGGLAVLAALGRRTGGGFGQYVTLQSALLLTVGLGLVGYFVWMLLRICLAFSASVVEERGAWSALKRATSLSKGTRGRMLVLYLLCAALSWVVATVMTVPVMVGISLIPQLNTPQHQQTLGALFLFLMYGASFASQAFIKPVSGIALMLFYYDQRIRKEAFDIEWMMREAGMEAPLTMPVSPDARPGAGGGLSLGSATAQEKTAGEFR